MMNVLDVEGSCSRLLENSIANTLLFVYFAYVVYPLFVTYMLLLVPGATRFVVHMCVCAALDNQHAHCILGVSVYLYRVAFVYRFCC